MLRNSVLIGELYGLGKPRKRFLNSVDYICYRFFSICDGLDHLDHYNNAFTAIPYCSVRGMSKYIQVNVRWQKAIRLGLNVSVRPCDPRIFADYYERPKRQRFVEKCCLIICSVSGSVSFAKLQKALMNDISKGDKL